MLIYLNGKYMPQERASISIDDRGFLFGDGVYEVTRAVRGRLFEAERHMQRLERGVRGLKMPASSFDAESLLDVANHLLAANALHDADAIVYMQITRGAAVRTHHFPPADTPVTVFASARAFASREQLRAQGVPAITHPDIRWARCDLKTINLLGNVLANQEARESGAHEALFVRDGIVTEGTHTNVFGVVDGELRTHPASPYVLPGITRAVVIELAAALGLPLRESPMLLDELRSASELFLTGTTTDVMPIVRVDGRLVGEGRPGPVAARLHAALYTRINDLAAVEAVR